jgi:hypothetical protein
MKPLNLKKRKTLKLTKYNFKYYKEVYTMLRNEGRKNYKSDSTIGLT